ncbi:integrase [Mannheimia haemolytica]|uniref:phage integrase N-terminal domain-containing protein n=1 Tax=Mannheimia haemolytica TaxID=75985 RepID=UPI0005CA9EDF|nr:phage integrase N-terminal domain-containing protein [Mannheimia haemolytica]KIX27874.1 integrase [Mannheimia haemolytica]HDL5009589.1 integrase domain-containing protein [Mannheimia haemolytica]HDL5444420.1 integrase domain-containing protein [Mannheimia haemolytica]
MRDLVYSVKTILNHNRDGSFGTQAEREKVLKMAMEELSHSQFKIHDCTQLKGKHIRFLVENWKNQALSTGTLKNRMSHLRWLAEKIGNPRIVERANSSYGIDNRKYVDNHTNKAKTLSESDLEALNDEFIRYSLRLQQEFGLRREESMKFQPKFADRETEIVLRDSWTKGGRARAIPIRTESQRELLNQIHAFCRLNHTKSLIPRERTYYQQLKSYEYYTASVGLHKNHGLRHEYAQQRYRELTGWECPKCGGKSSRMLSESEKQVDLMARLQISQELGHNREEITAVYLGR